MPVWWSQSHPEFSVNKIKQISESNMKKRGLLDVYPNQREWIWGHEANPTKNIVNYILVRFVTFGSGNKNQAWMMYMFGTERSDQFTTSVAKTGLFCDSLVNAMADDAQAPCVSKPSSAMVLTV